ncbi:MAG: PIN domain-containing protein [bacterium]
MINIEIYSNVLVYAYDRAELTKQSQALNLLDQLQTTGIGILSVQVLAEFFWVVSRKLSAPLPIEQALHQVELFVQCWSVVNLSSFIVLEAIRGVRNYQMAYWDAQIWATVHINQIPLIFSEDFATRTTIEGQSF